MNIASLITFINLKYLPKAEADKLNLMYTELKGTDRIGYDKYNELVVDKWSYHLFKDELFVDEYDNFYKDKELTDNVDSYQILTRLSEEEQALNYVELKEMHLVNLEEFLLNCNYPFKIIKSVRY